MKRLGNAAVAAAYPERLAAIGKVVALEPYVNEKTKILHRCLSHGEEHRTSPGAALMGGGLLCCRAAGSQKNGDRLFANAAASHASRLAAIGKLVMMEPYRGCAAPILYRCIEHGKEHRTRPADALKCKGFLCCRRQKIADKASDAYRKSLGIIGRLTALEPYQGSHKLILHRCLEHGEEHLCSPTSAKAGNGLRCCRRANIANTNARQSLAGAATYDEALKSFGRVIRLDPYIDKKTPILHRCLDHGEEHCTSPGSARQGRGLICCKRAAAGVNTFVDLIFRPDNLKFTEPCQSYIYGVADRPDLSKPGISKDHENRARQGRGLYDDLQAVWDLPSRRDALLIEGAILRDPSIPAPSDLGELAGLAGFTEVRSIAPAALAAHAQTLIDSLSDHIGPWQQWALDNVPTLRRAERVALRGQVA